MSRTLGFLSKLVSICPAVLLLLVGAIAAPKAALAAPTTNDPLDPLPGMTDELIYYYDYSAVPVTAPFGSDPGASDPLNKVTSDQRIIEDRSANGHHLINFDPTDVLFSEEVDQDFIFTSLGSTVGSNGSAFALPGARGFDTANGIGGITSTSNPLTHQGISDFGGYTFESYFKRTDPSPGVTGTLNLWNPEGMHSIEMRVAPLLFPPRGVDGDPNGNIHLQLALRGISNFAIDVDDVLPLDEWVHIMAVLTVTQPLPEEGNPVTDPLFAGYELFVNGESLVHIDDKGTPLDPEDDAANPLPSADLNLAPGSGGPFASLETSINTHHGIGTQEFGSPIEGTREFPGELAMTRLTYGALTPEQSLYNFDAPTEDADFDDSLLVDGEDFLIWQRGFGSGTTAAEGDANGSGGVDATDLGIWESQFGGAPPAVGSIAGVPEPSSMILLLSGLFVLRRRNR